MEENGRDNGRRLPSMFFKRGKSIEYIRRGSSFRRARRSGETETAIVKSVYTDGYNIPHVRFDVVFEKPFRAPVKDGPRILSLKEFFKQFPDRVSVAAPRQVAPSAPMAPVVLRPRSRPFGPSRETPPTAPAGAPLRAAI